MQENRERKKFFQNMLSWLIVIIFIVIMVDWNCIVENFKRAEKEYVGKGSPEFFALIEKRERLLQTAQKRAKAGELSLREAYILQMEIREVSQKSGVGGDTSIAELQRDFFVKNWKISDNSSDMAKHLHKLGNDRKLIAQYEWRRQSLSAHRYMQEQGYYKGALNSANSLNVFRFVVKWYYLFTIPTLLVILLNVVFAGESLAEKLWFEWRRILMASLAGPFGVFLISDSVGKIKRFRELKYAYRELKGIVDPWEKLTDHEEQAIWIQTMEPYLKFEEALRQVGTVSVKKPAVVCFALWLMSLSVSSFAFIKLQPPEKIVEMSVEVTQTWDKFFEIKKHPEKVLGFELAIVRSQLTFDWLDFSSEEFFTEAVLSQRIVYLFEIQPRGPPKIAVGRSANDNQCFLLTAKCRGEIV